MALSKQDLILLLGNEEPNYSQIKKKMGKDDIIHLKQIAESRDMMMASKAVYLAGLLKEEDANNIVEKAAKSKKEILKIAAASTLPNLNAAKRNAIALKLIDEEDVSVKKLVIKSLDRTAPVSLKNKVQLISRESTSNYLKRLSTETLNKFNN